MKTTEITIKLSGKLEIGTYVGREGEEEYNGRIIVIDGEPLDYELSILDGKNVTITVSKEE